MSFELFCRYFHHLEEVNWCCPQAHRPQTIWNQKVDDPDSQLSHYQPIGVHKLVATHSLDTLRLVANHSRAGHTVLRALTHCGPLCLAKQENYSFLLHPKLCLQDSNQHRCSEAEFSTSIPDSFGDCEIIPNRQPLINENGPKEINFYPKRF